jgi:hypothetical protein
MGPSLRNLFVLCAISLSRFAQAQQRPQQPVSPHQPVPPQQDNDGYIGYNLEQTGDSESARYNTAQTHSHTGIDTLNEVPDVYLNASVYVGEISIQVDNITAKVNVDAKVLNLLHFRAGVDASIDRVKLTIQNISAEVELEARLENVVEMVGDVLNSIDLNPIIATLGHDINSIVNKTVGILTQPVDEKGNPIPQPPSQPQQPPQPQPGQPAPQKRDVDDYRMDHGILYSVNDFTDHTHTNRILAQNGSIVDIFLDNEGDQTGEQIVGYYSRDMSFTGHNKTISVDGVVKEYELRYIYAPYPALEAVCNIYMDPSGKIVRTRVIAESEGGATSTISEDEEQDTDPEL